MKSTFEDLFATDTVNYNYTFTYYLGSANTEVEVDPDQEEQMDEPILKKGHEPGHPIKVYVLRNDGKGKNVKIQLSPSDEFFDMIPSMRVGETTNSTTFTEQNKMLTQDQKSFMQRFKER